MSLERGRDSDAHAVTRNTLRNNGATLEGAQKEKQKDYYSVEVIDIYDKSGKVVSEGFRITLNDDLDPKNCTQLYGEPDSGLLVTCAYANNTSGQRAYIGMRPMTPEEFEKFKQITEIELDDDRKKAIEAGAQKFEEFNGRDYYFSMDRGYAIEVLMKDGTCLNYHTDTKDFKASESSHILLRNVIENPNGRGHIYNLGKAGRLIGEMSDEQFETFVGILQKEMKLSQDEIKDMREAFDQHDALKNTVKKLDIGPGSLHTTVFMAKNVLKSTHATEDDMYAAYSAVYSFCSAGNPEAEEAMQVMPVIIDMIIDHPNVTEYMLKDLMGEPAIRARAEKRLAEIQNKK